MKKILITGGPVFAYLDQVKIITNRFRGGLMASLAESFIKNEDFEIFYLTTRGSTIPKIDNVDYHNGLNDYKKKVLAYAKDMNGIVLGAAVCNLIPAHPIQGKFPSHNYSVGDEINIKFKIAPRIIDMVKKENPQVNLFGFKLLSHVSEEELVKAAYGVLLESKSNYVFANDTRDLNKIKVVTKERSVHPICRDDIVKWIVDSVQDKYFKTIIDNQIILNSEEYDLAVKIMKKYEHLIKLNQNFEYVFGSIAIRLNDGSFITTARGKQELYEFSKVKSVNFEKLEIQADKKASLNAPLLSRIFSNNPDINIIVHSHRDDHKFPVLPYAPSGTLRDSDRDVKGSFTVDQHGYYMLKEN